MAKLTVSDKNLAELNKLEVKYGRKKYTAAELLVLLAEENTKLKKNQCKPRTACLFKAQRYLDNKFIEGM